MRRLPAAAAGMAVTAVAMAKSVMRNSGRESSTALASLGPVRSAAGTAATEVGKIEYEPQTVVTPQWLHDQLELNTNIKVISSSILYFHVEECCSACIVSLLY